MEYFAEGSEDTVIDGQRAGELVDAMLEHLGPMRRVLIVPPDYTRARSYAGELTVMLYERLKGRTHVEIMPALGTHAPMMADELDAMFPGIPYDAFRVHDWRHDLTRLGEVPGEFVREVSEGKLDYPIACEVNGLLVEGEWNRIISIGQLVPHEVAGIANQNKNVFIGTGGADTINKTHFLGAVYGMERMMGRPDTPVRRVLDYMTEHFGGELPISYLLTVRARDTSRETDASGHLVTRGLFGGDDAVCFTRGAELCRRVNIDLLDEPIDRAVVTLDAGEFKSTWLGNKAIYRTRMAMADGGELIILAPGVKEFGEDAEIDRLIRMHGYRGTPRTLEAARLSDELAANLSAAAHLIHGSSEGRFTITYCPGHLSRDEIEGVGFRYANLDEMMKRYDPQQLRDGYNTLPNGERVFYVSNPGLGLWALRSKFEE